MQWPKILIFCLVGVLVGVVVHLSMPHSPSPTPTNPEEYRLEENTADSSTGEGSAHTAHISHAPADILGSLSPDEVEGVLEAGHADFITCYQSALGRSPRLGGTATLSLIAASDGSVGSAFLVGSTLNDQTFEECLTDAADAWTFPATNSGVTRLLVPYTFASPG